MSSHESTGAIVTSFVANIGIAAAKFVAFLFTGAASMLAESIHSFVDSSNQVLLYVGGRRAAQAPTRTHPFGYARAHFLYAFVVAIILFTLGGLFAIYEGVHKIREPHALESPLAAYVVLAVSIILEIFALRGVLKEARTFKPERQSWWEFIRQTKSVNHVVLALEDAAALVGLVFALAGVTATWLTGNGVWDGVATLCIGALLVVVAIILFAEVKSLLIGEALSEDDEARLRTEVTRVEGVNKLIDLKTLYVGPLELFVAMKIAVGHDETAKSVAAAIDEVEARVRAAFPIAKLIYVEPDLFRSRAAQAAADAEIAARVGAESGDKS